MRLIKLLQELKEKEDEALQEAAAEISGQRATGAAKKLKGVMSIYEKSETAKLDALFNASSALAERMNEGIDKLKNRATNFAQMGMSTALAAAKKKKKKSKRRDERRS